MKAEINNLTYSFEIIFEALKSRKELIETEIEEIEDFAKEMTLEIPEAKRKFELFKETILLYKKDELKFQNEIQSIRNVLSGFIVKLNELKKQEEINKFGHKISRPNSDFIKIIEQKLISPDQELYTMVNNKEVYGNFTPEGYFILKNSPKKFSSLTTALSFIHNKQCSNGWTYWYVKNNSGDDFLIERIKEKIQ